MSFVVKPVIDNSRRTEKNTGVYGNGASVVEGEFEESTTSSLEQEMVRLKMQRTARRCQKMHVMV